MQLNGMTAMITGASSGIGRATAKLFAREGARVGLLARHEDEVRESCEEIAAEGGEVIPLIGDISDAERMKEASDKLAEESRRIDIVFANAGINGVWAPLEELKVEEFDKTIQVNLHGTFITLKSALPHMKQHGGAMIVNSSVNGTRIFSNTGATAYAASKAAQVALAKMLAVELAQYKIRVNTLCPGAISTSIEESTERRNVEKVEVPVEFPEGRIPLTGGDPGSPDQVAHVALFLASSASSHVTGTVIFVDGAESLLQG